MYSTGFKTVLFGSRYSDTLLALLCQEKDYNLEQLERSKEECSEYAKDHSTFERN
jgi:hypothetical protein